MELQLALQLLESFANAPHGVATMRRSVHGTTGVVDLDDS
jgi:hypothetical protein